jgi:hypothetical protein
MEIEVPEGLVLPAVFAEAAGATNPQVNNALDNIADEFTDALAPGESPMAGGANQDSFEIGVDEWARKKEHADASYRALVGYQAADESERECAGEVIGAAR